MDNKYIIYNVDDRGVATLKFNRPEKLNAWNDAMQIEIRTALEATNRNPKVKILLLTAEGRSFGSGLDLKDAADFGDWSAGGAFPPIAGGIDRIMKEMDKITIAAIDGMAAGMSCDIALSCDFRIASDKAAFWEPYFRLLPPSGGAWYLPRMVGLQKAFAMLILGEKVDAEEAYRIGLVYKTVPHDQLMSTVEEVIGKLLTLSPAVLHHTKHSIMKGLEQNFETTMEYIRYARALCGHLGIIEEAAKALIEKRPPTFKY